MAHPARLLRALGLAGAYIAVSGIGAERPEQPKPAPVIRPAPVDVGSDIAAFYRDRGFVPLWTSGPSLRPEARTLLRMLRQAGRLDHELTQAIETARGGDRHAVAHADLLLTRAFVDFANERHRPPAHRTIRYIDRDLAPGPHTAREWLDAAVQAPSLAAHLEEVQRVNPALDGFRQGLATYRARWSRLPQVEIEGNPGERQRRLRQRLGLVDGSSAAELATALREFQTVHGLPATGRPDDPTIGALNAGAAHYERLILANVERARAIPARRGRYLLVDTASARLWMIEDGRIVGAMRVIVGKAAMPTPAMAGMIRYAVLNPYWNLPPDLIRERARKVLRQGTRAIAAERLQILSDWSPRARPLSPHQVDWRAVATGRRYVNLRQRPGRTNMMGAIKFMMPNDLGVYLHDTPLRHFFAREDRRVSSGCVRVEDAPRLARWLFRDRPPTPSGRPEERADLPEGVPVYITYLTALPSRGGIVFVPDRYGRDRALVARMVAGLRPG